MRLDLQGRWRQPTTVALALLILAELVLAGVQVRSFRDADQVTGSGPAPPAAQSSPRAESGSQPPLAPSSSAAPTASTQVAPPRRTVSPAVDAPVVSAVANRPLLPRPGDNVVLQWNATALEAVRRSKLGPPMVSRALAMLHTCMYDAWAAYDQVALGTRLGSRLRQPEAERNLSNQVEAVSFAAYLAAADLFPELRESLFNPLMARLGFEAPNPSTTPSKSAAVGVAACRAVLDFRHRDGANQLGDHPGGVPGVPYADYTGYRPVNEPMDLRREFDPTTVRDPERWQPLTYIDSSGSVVTPAFLAPHWNRVAPFAMSSPAVLRSPTGPARSTSITAARESVELLAMSAQLTDEHKVIAEYWADGPRSETPPGHWNLLAHHVSRRDGHGSGAEGVAADVKLFFALNNAMFDAGIAAWDNKIAFDSVRPITAIRHHFRGKKVLAWGGPYQGTKLIDGEDWLPYQPSTFPTPPFAEYSSGHSNFSGAAAQVLRDFTGSDHFGLSLTIPAGSSAVEPGAVPARDVKLSWATFSDAAAQAGLSRRYGGIHFEQGDLDARLTGKTCGQQAWAKALAYFSGVAT